MDAKCTDRLRVVNPRDLSITTTGVHVAGEEDVELAVKAAREAFQNGPWSTTSGSGRGKLLWKLADLIEANGQHLAGLESLAMGSSPAMSLAMEIRNVTDVLRCECFP